MGFVYTPGASGGSGGGGVPVGDSITPFVVSSDGTYNTIQDAVDAAEAAGGGLVWVHPGSYTEDVTVASDDVYIAASPRSVTIVGEMSIDAGDGVGDPAASHRVGLQGLTLVAGVGDSVVLSISGNPQTVVLEDVFVDAGTGAVDGLSFDVSSGQLDLRRCKVFNQAGGTGTPFDIQSGHATFYEGCQVEFADQDDTALVVTGGSIESTFPLIVKGTVRNESVGVNGVAALFHYLYLETNNTEAFDCQGAGIVLVYQGVVADVSGSTPDLGIGAGGFAWAPLDIHVSAYGDSSLSTVNAAAGPLSLSTIGGLALRQVATGGNDGQLLTADGLGSYGWEDAPEQDASATTYTPTDAGDWDPDPSTVEEGLDQLGARVQDLETTVVITLVTATTDSINGGGTATDDLDIALPAGVTSCVIQEILVERTAGTSTGVSVAAYVNDDRSDASPRYLAGTSFSGVDASAGFYGPSGDFGGSQVWFTVPYINLDSSSFIRLRVTETSFNDGTFDVTLKIIPM